MESNFPAVTPPVNIVFPGSFIQANIFSALLCILLPLLFLWYYKRKTGVKIGSFFIGAAFCLLFSFIVPSILDFLILYFLRLGHFLNAINHPLLYSAIYVACSRGLTSTIGSYVGLKYAMKNHPGKENALVFGVGMGGFESIFNTFNSSTIYITNLITAVLVNSVGSAEYFKKLGLTAAELENRQKLFSELAATPATDFFMDATYMILSLILYAAITLLIFYAISKKEIRLLPVSIVLHILGYVPMYLHLHKFELFQNSVILFVIATVYTFAIALFAYQMYHRAGN